MAAAAQAACCARQGNASPLCCAAPRPPCAAHIPCICFLFESERGAALSCGPSARLGTRGSRQHGAERALPRPPVPHPAPAAPGDQASCHSPWPLGPGCVQELEPRPVFFFPFWRHGQACELTCVWDYLLTRGAPWCVARMQQPASAAPGGRQRAALLLCDVQPSYLCCARAVTAQRSAPISDF
jgi:hypothetical protein